MTRQNINVACDLKASAGRTFTGYGSVFDIVDSYQDRIVRGAFTASLRSKSPKMLWQHKYDHPIGKWTTVREDARGLYVEGELADTGLGREVHTLLKMGALDGLSIGFNIERATANTYGGRDIAELTLHEISIVTFPANEAALVGAVKSNRRPTDIHETLDRLESFLEGDQRRVEREMEALHRKTIGLLEEARAVHEWNRVLAAQAQQEDELRASMTPERVTAMQAHAFARAGMGGGSWV